MNKKCEHFAKDIIFTKKVMSKIKMLKDFYDIDHSLNEGSEIDETKLELALNQIKYACNKYSIKDTISPKCE